MADTVEDSDNDDFFGLDKAKEQSMKAVHNAKDASDTPVAIAIDMDAVVHKRMRHRAYRTCIIVSSFALAVIIAAIAIRYISGVPGKP